MAEFIPEWTDSLRAFCIARYLKAYGLHTKLEAIQPEQISKVLGYRFQVRDRLEWFIVTIQARVRKITSDELYPIS